MNFPPNSASHCPGLHIGDLRDAAISQGIVAQIAGITIWRWLTAAAIKPWQHRSWIFPRDSDFATKAGRVLDLYARRWHGKPLRPDTYVISADEKTSIQARIRRHTTLPAGPGRPMRVEHEYRRGGALAYMAALDVHHARVIGRCEPTTGIEPFERLVADVMTCEPYASAPRVYWITDNGSSHRGQASIDRMVNDWPTARLVHHRHVPEVAKLARFVGHWQTEILAWHDTGGASNARCEATNLAIKAVKRVGRGFRDFDNYRLRLLLHAGTDWHTHPTARLRSRRSPLSAA